MHPVRQHLASWYCDSPCFGLDSLQHLTATSKTCKLLRARRLPVHAIVPRAGVSTPFMPLRVVGPLLASDDNIASHKSPVAGDNAGSTIYFPLCSLNECLPGLWVGMLMGEILQNYRDLVPHLSFHRAAGGTVMPCQAMSTVVVHVASGTCDILVF